MAQIKKGLGRGLSALIPDDMDFLSGVARGDFDLTAIADNLDSQLDSQKVATASDAKANAEDKAAQKRARSSSARLTSNDVSPIEATPETVISETSSSDNTPLRWLAADAVVANPYQPRRIFDDEELHNLADSIREHGILQPVIVRPLDANNGSDDAKERFQLVAGERRWRAAQLAGLTSLPAIVRPVSDQQALELAVIENVQRHDISPLDAAQAYRRLATEFELSQEKIARRVGKSRSAIANTMRLLELPVEARDALQDGTLSEGHGRAILLAPGEGARRAAFRAVLRDKLSVRDTEELARRIAVGDMPPVESDPAPSSEAKTNQGHNAQLAQTDNMAELNQLAEQLQNTTGCRVQFRPRRQGGQFVIHCNTSADATRLAKVFASEKAA